MKYLLHLGIGVFWADGNPDNVAKPISGRQTNQRAEIQAAIAALKIAKKRGYNKLTICTDSQYVVNGATDWIYNWLENGFKNLRGHPVTNRDDWRELHECRNRLGLVQWEYVAGHANNYGNNQADKLANEGARMGMNGDYYESD